MKLSKKIIDVWPLYGIFVCIRERFDNRGAKAMGEKYNLKT